MRTNIGAQSSAATASFVSRLAALTPVTNDGTERIFLTTGGYDQVEILDATNSFNPATGVFTAPEAGVYRFDAQTSYNNFPGTRSMLYLFVNGVATRALSDFYTPAIPIRNLGFGYLTLAQGDEVQLGYNISGGSTSATANNITTTPSWWSGYKM